MAELPPEKLSNADSAVTVDENGVPGTIAPPKNESEVTRSTKQRISDIFTIVSTLSTLSARVLINL